MAEDREFDIKYPKTATNRGGRFWVNPLNLIAARSKFRMDRSSQWRDVNERSIPPTPLSPGQEPRTRSFKELLPSHKPGDAIRAVILGDSGEGDHSQYGLVPLIRALKPHFMIIDGDVAYPAGQRTDYIEGFFEPYNDLGIPIWAVPGNHEYYSPNKGREFVDVFCTRKYVNEWKRFGLRFVPQPGTYWELSDSSIPPDSKITNVSFIGIDSGHSGNLDSDESSDAKQMEWLGERLLAAEKENRKVILLFHIPILVSGELDSAPQLRQLHKLIASSNRVKAVICGHIHNFQAYERSVFGKALCEITGEQVDSEPPAYFVSGGGGAYLAVPPKSKGLTYPIHAMYPDVDQWRGQAAENLWQGTISHVRRGIAKVKLSQSGIDRLFASMQEGALEDADKPSLLSLLYVEINQNGATITPVFLSDLSKLYPDEVELISIRNTNPPPDSGLVENCKQNNPEINDLTVKV